MIRRRQGRSSVAPYDHPGQSGCQRRGAEEAQLGLVETGSDECEASNQQGDGETDARDGAGADDRRPSDRRAQAPAREAGDRKRHAERAERLAGEVAQQDTHRHWGSGGAPEHIPVDGDPGVGQREERHDGVARPGVVEGEQPLVRRNGGAQASSRRALSLRRGLLPEPAETLDGPMQLRPTDGTSPEQQVEEGVPCVSTGPLPRKSRPRAENSPKTGQRPVVLRENNS